MLLQEVDQDARRSNADRQVDVLGDFLGLRHRTYFPNVRVLSGGEYGNAILSRFPLTETSNIDVTVPPKKRRSVLHATLPGALAERGPPSTRTLHVYNLHLGLSGIERKIQLRKFLESHPFVGLHHRTPIVDRRRLQRRVGHARPEAPRPRRVSSFGTPRSRPFPRGVLSARSTRFMSAATCVPEHLIAPDSGLATRASDHLPLIAELEVT